MKKSTHYSEEFCFTTTTATRTPTPISMPFFILDILVSANAYNAEY